MAYTLYKWILTIVVAPLLILWAVVERLRYGHRIVTVGFVTMDPTMIIGYIKHLAPGLALFLSLLTLIGGGASQQVAPG